MKIPSVSVEQMRQVDKSAVEDFGLQILMMMENASIHIADLTEHMLSGNLVDKKVAILAHKGNNGGDGLGAARHLMNRGAHVTVLLSTSPYELGGEAAKQYRVLQNSTCQIIEVPKENICKVTPLMKNSDIIIDGLLGYNINGNPRNPIDTLITAANASKVPILSIDIPSGLDGETGKAFHPTIHATITVTLALPKNGLLKPESKRYVGDLWLADLSIPDNLYRRIGIEISTVFATSRLFQLEADNT